VAFPTETQVAKRFAAKPKTKFLKSKNEGAKTPKKIHKSTALPAP